MARTRTLTLLRDEVRQLVDIESATNRVTDAELTRHINQGIAWVYDLLIAARGRSYYRNATPQSITTTASTVTYPLESDFYQLIGVRIDDGPSLEKFAPIAEAELALSSASASYPLFYDLQGAYIALRPYHSAGYTVIVDYVPYSAELSADGDTFDGINGWEDGVVLFAGRKCALKDETFERADRIAQDMAQFERRVNGLASKRYRFRAERIQDARGTRGFRRYWPYP